MRSKSSVQLLACTGAPERNAGWPDLDHVAHLSCSRRLDDETHGSPRQLAHHHGQVMWLQFLAPDSLDLRVEHFRRDLASHPVLRRLRQYNSNNRWKSDSFHTRVWGREWRVRWR